MRRRVTFSRNLTLSLSRTCRCSCKYCAFATHRPHLHEPDEVEALLERAARRRVKELLVLTGERPESHPEVGARLRELGHEDFTSYVTWVCQRALEHGLLPHTNLGVLSAADLARLREVTASQGLMLESVRPDLEVHRGSPTKAPDAYWRTGLSAPPEVEPPGWATPIDLDDMRRLVAEARRLLPGVGVQVPPNLADWWPELVDAGATDLGGLSANGDHISPEHPFPSPHQVRRRLAPLGYALTERLCVYPQFIDPEWVAQGVLDVIKLRYWSFIPRRGSGRREERPAAPDAAPRAVEKARDGAQLSPDELAALFGERRPEVIEEMRAAADDLRAELAGDTVTFVVNRNINVSNICIVGCA